MVIFHTNYVEFPPKLYDKLRTSQTKAYKSISNDSDSDMVKRAGPAATTATAAPTTVRHSLKVKSSRKLTTVRNISRGPLAALSEKGISSVKGVSS